MSRFTFGIIIAEVEGMNLGLLARLAFGYLMLSVTANAQTTLESLTRNNTAACPAEGALPSHCKQTFAGQSDPRPLVATPLFDAPAGNVSDEDPHIYLKDGEATKIFASVMTAFCTEGTLESCHNNVRTGYNSDDDLTVAAQVEDMKRRHIDGAILVWAGNGTSQDEATLKFQRYLSANDCKAGQACDHSYLIMYDGAAMDWNVSSSGIAGTTSIGCGDRIGVAYEDCVIEHIRNDMCYLNGMHWGSDAYLKVNGRPVVQIFPNEGVIAPEGPAPSWTDVWVHVADWNRNLPQNCGKPPFNIDHGIPLIIFEDSVGFRHAASSGAYYWIKVDGTDPAHSQFLFDLSSPSSSETLQQFYENGRKFPDRQTWGAAFKGFNSSRSAWGTNRILDQACGQLWVASLSSSNLFATSGLNFLQIITWNDYNEGTEIESGIDNCYTVRAEIQNKQLTWKLESSNRLANLMTVSSIEIYDSSDGKNLTLLDKVKPATTGTWSLAGLRSGSHTIYVRMVGKNSILNRISPGVSFIN
jgi:hypothetical protein